VRPKPMLIAISLVLAAQAQEAGTPLSRAQRSEVVEALARALKAEYVFPEVAESAGKALQDKVAKGGYEGAVASGVFSEALTRDLREFGRDGHFRVRFDPAFDPKEEDEGRVPTPEEVAKARADSARRAFGIAKIEQLPGNVGYLEVLGFGPTEFVGPAFTAAMQILSGTDALILDLRRNGGGDPESVAYLVSHFFPEGDARHLNSIYDRPRNTTRQYWTSPVAVRYSRPIYVLTSKRTFSGGEECAYDLQTQKRATLVGETTGGGANPGHPMPLVHGFTAFIPTGRAINPVTNTNWEHVGVKPDVTVSALEAIKVAHSAILKTMLEKEKDPEQRKRLEAILSRVEKAGPDPVK
jgi:hypothetical protein